MYQESLENVITLENKLKEAELEYDQDRPKFWVVLSVSVILGLVLGV